MPVAMRQHARSTSVRSTSNRSSSRRAVPTWRVSADFYRDTPPPHFTARSIAACYTVLLGACSHAARNPLSKLPVELLKQICLEIRTPIDDGSAYHYVAQSSHSMLSLWLICQHRHQRHDFSPSSTRIVLEHVELPDDPGPGAERAVPLVTRILGHYQGFSGRNLLVRWTHRVEAQALELCDWPAACTAEELRAPRIAASPRRKSLKSDTRDDIEANPLMLVLPQLPHAQRVQQTSLDLERLCFKKVLLARPDVYHTSVVLSGSPTGQTLQEVPDSLGDAEECFVSITTGARDGEEEECMLAEDNEARVLLAMAAILEECQRIESTTLYEEWQPTSDEELEC